MAYFSAGILGSALAAVVNNLISACKSRVMEKMLLV